MYVDRELSCSSNSCASIGNKLSDEVSFVDFIINMGPARHLT
jgi:hypothetical protein